MRLFPLALPTLLLLACDSTATIDLGKDTGNTGLDSGDTGGVTDTSETGETGDTAVLVGEIEVAPPSIELPILFVGQSETAAITVTNVGTGPVSVTVTVLGGHAADWTLDAYTSAPEPGATVTHTASLTPTAWGDYSVSLLVADATNGGSIEVPVTAHVQEDADGDLHGSTVSGGDDCDDLVATTFPGADEVWYDGVDSNCDGVNDYDQDGDGVNVGVDCDDTDASSYPGAADHWYDGVDSDCAGNDDYDQDADGSQSADYGGDDCDDTDATLNPSAADAWYDGIDSNCDGADEYDADGDGAQSADYGGDDCDDTDASIYVGAPDTWYDGIDSDCLGDDDYDQDLDGVAYPTDCNDTDATVTGPVTETWNGLDDDCDGLVDDLSATDVATGILYGYSSSMGVGNKGQLAMDNDVTGDGLGDLVVTASGSGYGYGWVVSGATAASSIGDLDDYDTAIVSGEQYYTLSYVNGPFADVDGDATHDVILGGYYAGWYSSYGRVYEFDGGAALTGSIAVASYSARFTGDDSTDGTSQGASGDFDGDGVGDVAIGSQVDDYSSGSWSGSDYDAGSVSVFDGAVSGDQDLDDADDRIYGDNDYDYLGVSLTVVDLDGDGYDDILAGASGYDASTTGTGTVFLFAGNSSLGWDTRSEDAASLQIDGDSYNLQLGEDALANPGDVDGDGSLDLGLSSEDDGSVWVFLDGTALTGNLDTTDADYTITGTAGDIGSMLVMNSDLDGDGNDDVIVGSDGDDTAASNAGAVYVFTYASTWAAALTSADAAAAFTGTAADEYFGSGGAGGADLDGDGNEDLAVGATSNDSSVSNGGAVYVIPGR